jgi:hypothetical protein
MPCKCLSKQMPAAELIARGMKVLDEWLDDYRRGDLEDAELVRRRELLLGKQSILDTIATLTAASLKLEEFSLKSGSVSSPSESGALAQEDQDIIARALASYMDKMER